MESNDCPICLREIKSLSLITTKCNHQFCYKCMEKWIKTNPTCPMDRNEITDLHIYNGDKFEETINLSKLFESFFNKISSKSDGILKDGIEIATNHIYLMMCIDNEFLKNCCLIQKIKFHIATIKLFRESKSKCPENYLKNVFLQTKVSISQFLKTINKIVMKIRKYKLNVYKTFARLSNFSEKLNLMKTTSTKLLSIQEEMENYQDILYNIYKDWDLIDITMTENTIYYQSIRSIVMSNETVDEKLKNFSF